MKKGVIIAIFLFLAGCTTQESISYIKDGKIYGVTSGLFRNRWWNYYERGLSFAEGGFYKEASNDLRLAIEGRRDDAWRSRTYGMHFVNYFPHRELGIIHYKLKAYANASDELARSLETAESAKAKYFLNKSRKALLQVTGKDRFVPTLRLTTPVEDIITNKFSLTLSGIAEDDTFVSSVSVDARPILQELSAKQIPFEIELPLKNGMNTIKVKASDLLGKTTEQVLRVEVDREGPLIIIEDIVTGAANQKTADRKVILSGMLSDSTMISSFRINGEDVLLSKIPNAPEEAAFRHEIHLSDETATIKLRAGDIAGNITQGKLDPFANRLNAGHSPPQHRLAGEVRLAVLSDSTRLDAISKALFEEKERKPSPISNILSRLSDDTPPVISVKDLNDTQTVYYDAIYIEGEVSDDSQVRSVTLNGLPILKHRGKKVFFSHLIGLKEGKNRVSIEALDIFGNSSYKNLNFIRRVKKIRQIGSRMSLSPLPLRRKGMPSLAGDMSYESLISAFVHQGRFNIIERDRMEAVLRELKLDSTELVDPQTASKIGKIVVADAILTGTIYETADSIEVLTRLINTETSTIVAAKDVYGEDKSFPAIQQLMEGLAMKYRQRFPLLEGLVIKKEGKRIWVDLGGKDRLKQDMDFILFREDEVLHPITGKSLGAESTILGEARVEDIFEVFSRAKIVREKGPGEIRIKQGVITK